MQFLCQLCHTGKWTHLMALHIPHMLCTQLHTSRMECTLSSLPPPRQANNHHVRDCASNRSPAHRCFLTLPTLALAPLSSHKTLYLNPAEHILHQVVPIFLCYSEAHWSLRIPCLNNVFKCQKRNTKESNYTGVQLSNISRSLWYGKKCYLWKY